MNSKIISKIVFLLVLLSVSNVFAEENDVKFITGYIQDVNDNKITLSNNMVFRANEHVTAISMTPVVFVLGKNSPDGFVYIKNRKVDVTLMKKSGSRVFMPAAKQDLVMYSDGQLFEVTSFSLNNGKISLKNGDNWFLTEADAREQLKNWQEADFVIIYKSSGSESMQLINARTTDQVKISKTHKKLTAE